MHPGMDATRRVFRVMAARMSSKRSLGVLALGCLLLFWYSRRTDPAASFETFRHG